MSSASEIDGAIAEEALKWLNGLSERSRTRIFKSVIEASLKESLRGVVERHLEDVIGPRVQVELDRLFREGWQDSGVRFGSKVGLADYVARVLAVQLNTQLARMKANISVTLSGPEGSD